MNRHILLLNSVKFLKPIQIYYRLYYFVRAKFRKIVGFKYRYFKNSNSYILKLDKSIRAKSTYNSGEFKFLNLSKKFKKIDWNFADYGKLWTYNLTYFDFLSQKSDIFLIYDFIDNIEGIDDGLEPYPISLRGVNWIKYISHFNIKNRKIDDSLYAQYYILMDNLEYHILGNHLLEDGFSLLFGAYYFRDERLYNKAKEILLEELEEQILDDGGDFELSPMYHQIILFRLLDSINLVKNSSWKHKELFEFLSKKAEIMLGWLVAISYSNGDIPMFNDSSKDIAPRTEELKEYSDRLDIKIRYLELKDSGYRKISNSSYESIIDIGAIKSTYISGHTHSDIFNFELRVGEKEFIVDSGVSTYNISKQRDIERSTSSHNTVEINGKNQIEVWGGFRVANRGEVIDIKESKNIIEATHNGYRDILHTRRWIFNQDKITIEDSLSREAKAIARLHFHPSISKEHILSHIDIKSSSWRFNKYSYSNGFNRLVEANSIEIYFKKSLKVDIFPMKKN